VTLGWQDFVAIGIVLLAVGYLARLALGALTRKEKSGCGAGCGKCSSPRAATRDEPGQLVEIGRARAGAR
jgi:hypothetical protein